jgi:hypothetical protein
MTDRFILLERGFIISQISAIAHIPFPVVYDGAELTITPTAITGLASNINPTVILGDLDLRRWARGIASTVAPVIAYGSSSVTPTAVSALSSALLGSVKIRDHRLKSAWLDFQESTSAQLGIEQYICAGLEISETTIAQLTFE